MAARRRAPECEGLGLGSLISIIAADQHSRPAAASRCAMGCDQCHCCSLRCMQAALEARQRPVRIAMCGALKSASAVLETLHDG